MGWCDRCGIKELDNGDGYCVYSEGGMVRGMVMGLMVICEECANELFTEEVWNNANLEAIEVAMSSMSFDTETMKREQRLVHDFSVALRAKRRGLTAALARQEARDIAELWWKNKKAGVQLLLAQSSTSSDIGKKQGTKQKSDIGKKQGAKQKSDIGKKQEAQKKCDFCGKSLSSSEQVVMLNKKALEKLEARSTLRHLGAASMLDPSGQWRWIACSQCMNRKTDVAKITEGDRPKKWWQLWK